MIAFLIFGLTFLVLALMMIAAAVSRVADATSGVMRELHYIRRVLDKEDDYAGV